MSRLGEVTVAAHEDRSFWRALVTGGTPGTFELVSAVTVFGRFATAEHWQGSTSHAARDRNRCACTSIYLASGPVRTSPATDCTRCLAVIETARGKVGNGGPLSQLDVTASVQRTPASREARPRCNLSIAPPQRSVRLSSQNQNRQGVPQDWYRRAVKSPLGYVFDSIVVFTTLMTCLRLYLVGTA